MMPCWMSSFSERKKCHVWFLLTDISDDLIETSVVLQRKQTALEWRNMDWEIKVGALGILLSHFEAVF